LGAAIGAIDELALGSALSLATERAPAVAQITIVMTAGLMDYLC
jgi:hypothetical protein